MLTSENCLMGEETGGNFMDRATSFKHITVQSSIFFQPQTIMTKSQVSKVVAQKCLKEMKPLSSDVQIQSSGSR